MWLRNVMLIFVLVCEICGANQSYLFTNGWFKTKKKSEKRNLSNVESINPNNVPKTTYLKVSALIPVLFEGSIKDLEDLEDLTLSSCGINVISPGAFQNLPQLSRVNLKENGIEHIKAGVFNNLRITVLFLNKNQITTIDSDAFDNMPNLTRIKLNSNQISVWDSEWFKNTPLLNFICVRRNLIKQIPENAFKHFAKTEMSSSGRKLSDVKIFLSKNGISEITPGAFRGLRKVGQIWFDRNNLTRLDPAVFEGIEQINDLVLVKNNFTELPKDLFNTVKLVKRLDLTTNHRLACLPFELVKVVRFLQLGNNRGLNCTCMKELEAKITELEHEIRFECPIERRIK